MGEKLAAYASAHADGGLGREILSAGSAYKADDCEGEHNAAHRYYNARVTLLDTYVNNLRYGKRYEQLKDGFKAFEQGREYGSEFISLKEF